MEEARLNVIVSGVVQGVGFRWWTRSQADRFGLRGSAVNRSDGRVEIVAEGPRTAAEQLLDALRGPGAPGRVDGAEVSWGPSQHEPAGFRVG